MRFLFWGKKKNIKTETISQPKIKIEPLNKHLKHIIQKECEKSFDKEFEKLNFQNCQELEDKSRNLQHLIRGRLTAPFTNHVAKEFGESLGRFLAIVKVAKKCNPNKFASLCGDYYFGPIKRAGLIGLKRENKNPAGFDADEIAKMLRKLCETNEDKKFIGKIIQELFKTIQHGRRT